MSLSKINYLHTICGVHALCCLRVTKGITFGICCSKTEREAGECTPYVAMATASWCHIQHESLHVLFLPTKSTKIPITYQIRPIKPSNPFFINTIQYKRRHSQRAYIHLYKRRHVHPIPMSISERLNRCILRLTKSSQTLCWYILRLTKSQRAPRCPGMLPATEINN